MKSEKDDLLSESKHVSFMLIRSRSMPHVFKIFKILRTASSTFIHWMLTALRCAHTNGCSIEFWDPVALKRFCKIHIWSINLVRPIEIHGNAIGRYINIFTSKDYTLVLSSWRVSISRIGEFRRMQTRSMGVNQSLSNRVFKFPNMGHRSKSHLQINWIKTIRNFQTWTIENNRKWNCGWQLIINKNKKKE
jgi:hypothetical protein